MEPSSATTPVQTVPAQAGASDEPLHHASIGAAVGAFLVVLGLLGFAVAIGGNPLALVFPLHGLIGLLLLSFLESGAILGFANVFAAIQGGCSADAPRKELETTLSQLRVIDQTILVSGGTMVLMGLIMMLARSSEPSTIGPAVAFALQTSILTIFLSRFLVYPLLLRVRGRLGWPAAAPRERLLANLAWVVLPLANLLGFLLVLFTLKGGN